MTINMIYSHLSLYKHNDGTFIGIIMIPYIIHTLMSNIYILKFIYHNSKSIPYKNLASRVPTKISKAREEYSMINAGEQNK